MCFALDKQQMAFLMICPFKLMITEKERNLETNKLIHRTLITFNNIKQRLETLVNLIIFIQG